MIRLSLVALWLVLSVTNARAQEVTAYLTRHAEKETTGAGNPDLTQKGESRAERYIQLLQHVPITAVYSTDTVRTRATAAPLARAKNVPVQIYQVGKLNRRDLIEQHAGEAIFIVGHSNTIPKMINRLLNSDQFTEIDEQDYDDFFIVALRDKTDSSATHLLLPLMP